MYIRLLMYPVQMPSLMYLIFAKKQRITFFDPPSQKNWEIENEEVFLMFFLGFVGCTDEFLIGKIFYSGFYIFFFSQSIILKARFPSI